MIGHNSANMAPVTDEGCHIGSLQNLQYVSVDFCGLAKKQSIHRVWAILPIPRLPQYAQIFGALDMYRLYMAKLIKG